MKKGEKMSAEIKEKIRISNLGQKRSPETCKKIGLSKKGLPAPHMIGNKHIAGTKNPNYGKFGPNHPKWVENKVRPLHKAIRQLFLYRQWRSDIFTRDNFTCVLCGATRCEIQADHFPKRYIDVFNENGIKNIEQAIVCEELWNINNGRTLCVPCHRKTDTWGKKKRYLTN